MATAYAAYSLAAYVQVDTASKARVLSAQTARRPHSACVLPAAAFSTRTLSPSQTLQPAQTAAVWPIRLRSWAVRQVYCAGIGAAQLHVMGCARMGKSYLKQGSFPRLRIFPLHSPNKICSPWNLLSTTLAS